MDRARTDWDDVLDGMDLSTSTPADDDVTDVTTQYASYIRQENMYVSRIATVKQ